MVPKRTILGWSRPFLTQAVDTLYAQGHSILPGVLDLSHLAVLVPTRQAGRRVKEALAQKAARQDLALFAPAIHLPRDLMGQTRRPGDSPIATQAEMLVSWLAVLREVSPQTYPDLFPVNPQTQGLEWALPLANSLLQLQDHLLEALWGLDAFPVEPNIPPQEWPRWKDLQRLNARWEEHLVSQDRVSPIHAVREYLKAPVPLLDAETLVILGIPDLTPLVEALTQPFLQSEGLEVIIHGPEHAPEAFDDWGRPLPTFWKERPLNLPENLKLCRDPRDLADHILHQVEESLQSQSEVCIGLQTGEFIPSLQHRAKGQPFSFFDPAGTPFKRHPLYSLLQLLGHLLQEARMADVSVLLRHSIGLEWALSRFPDLSSTQLFTLVDTFQQRHLPERLEETRDYRDSPKLLLDLTDQVQSLLEQFEAATNPAAWMAALDQFIQPYWQQLEGEDRDILQSVADALEGTIKAFFSAPGFSAGERVSLICQAMADRPLYPRRASDAIDLLGWLELPWEPAPTLILTELNRESLPTLPQQDPFLPNSVREQMGLASYQSRWIRDRYLLESLLASRVESGAIHLLIPRSDSQGEPLQPSALLLQTDPHHLPTRVKALFGELEPAPPQPPWSAAWKWTPPPLSEAPSSSISVTEFSQYLDCPFRYYLQRVLRMESYDAFKTEWDAMEFGNLAHWVLEEWFQNKTLYRERDPDLLGDALVQLLKKRTTGHYGRSLPLPLIIQMDSLEQRIRAFAQHQVLASQEGWEVIETEWSFPTGKEVFEIDGVSIRGTSDRIERHTHSGVIRILDYKTSDKAVSPADAHFRKWKARDDEDPPPAYARFGEGKDLRIWTNLQLPLYAWGLRQRGETAPIELGYFHLPKAVADTRIQVLDTENTDALIEQALICARGVIERLQQQVFWPPRRFPRHDPFAELFMGGLDQSIDPTNLLLKGGPR